MAADTRPKCPVCGARVGDAAARDGSNRVLAPFNPAIYAPYSNPKNAAQAAAIRAKNEGKTK
jgi:hypothetical protein